MPETSVASAVKRVSLGILWELTRGTHHLLGLRGQQCSGAGKGKQAKEKLGQRLRAKEWGRETVGSNRFCHTEEGSRETRLERLARARSQVPHSQTQQTAPGFPTRGSVMSWKLCSLGSRQSLPCPPPSEAKTRQQL